MISAIIYQRIKIRPLSRLALPILIVNNRPAPTTLTPTRTPFSVRVRVVVW